MADINLLPEEKQSLNKFFTWILSYGRYIIIGTEIVVLLAFLSRFKFDRELTDLHQSIAQKQAVATAAYDLEQQIRKTQEYLSLVKKINHERKSSLKILTAFENATPQEITLVEFFVEPSRLSIKAITKSNEGLRVFINNLSASSFFGDISLDDIGKNQNGETEFKLSAAIKNI